MADFKLKSWRVDGDLLIVDATTGPADQVRVTFDVPILKREVTATATGAILKIGSGSLDLESSSKFLWIGSMICLTADESALMWADLTTEPIPGPAAVCPVHKTAMTPGKTAGSWNCLGCQIGSEAKEEAAVA